MPTASECDDWRHDDSFCREKCMYPGYLSKEEKARMRTEWSAHIDKEVERMMQCIPRALIHDYARGKGA